MTKSSRLSLTREERLSRWEDDLIRRSAAVRAGIRSNESQEHYLLSQIGYMESQIMNVDKYRKGWIERDMAIATAQVLARRVERMQYQLKAMVEVHNRSGRK